EALELFRQRKLTEARKKLDEARKLHDRRRFLRPRKQQNPESDPREEIFLLACDQIKAAWDVLEKLNNPDYLKLAAKDRLPQVEKLLQAQLSELSEKLVKDKGVKSADDLAKAVKAELKAANDKTSEVEEKLESKTKEAADLGNKLKDEGKKLVKAS